MFVFKKENQIFWILCEAWVSESLSASKITCGHLHFKSTKGSYVKILLNGIMGTWLPRNDLYPAQVDTYSELGMLRCKHHVLTPFWELAHVYIVPRGQQKWMHAKERDSGPRWPRSEAPLYSDLGCFSRSELTALLTFWPHSWMATLCSLRADLVSPPCSPPAYTLLAGLLSWALMHSAAATLLGLLALPEVAGGLFCSVSLFPCFSHLTT